MQRRRPSLVAALALALALVAFAQVAFAQETSTDPLWEQVAAIEQAQQQQANASDVLRVPLRRRSPRDVINAVLNRPTPGLRGSGEPGEGNIIIADVSNAQYFGEIQVGSQGQTFEVRFAWYECVGGWSQSRNRPWWWGG